MEDKIQRPAYYFSWPDDEILDAKLLEIPGDDETWLYRVERDGYNGHFRNPMEPNHYHTPSGSVDSRTFTRRKHALRPSVAESSLFNRSSLGIISTSLLNDTKLVAYSITPSSTNQGRISSSFTASDKAPVPRAFKLDTPFMNCRFERKRLDSELSDSSIIPSLDSQFDKNEAMTDSLVNFLEKPNVNCKPPAGFQDEKPMTESLVSLSEKESELGEESMTDSMVNFLEPVTCKPPSGFGDEEMCNSIVNIDDKEILPGSDMTSSLMDYLECGNVKAALNEAENIPPDSLHNREEKLSSFNDIDGSVDGKPGGKLTTTFEIEEGKDDTFNVKEDSDQSPEITFTNKVNISRTSKKEIMGIKDDRGFIRPTNTTFERENETVQRSRALNNKDLNVTQDLNDEDIKEFNLSKFKISNKTNSLAFVNSLRLNGTFTKSVNDNSSRLNGTFTKSVNDNSSRLNGTFTKSAHDSAPLNGTFTKNNYNSASKLSRQIPQRNSTFNTTFTKLDFPLTDLSRHMVTRSTEYLDAGAEDDRTSSASDSSFSSAASSNKPRSVDELRTIAQQQETDLQLTTSTPTEESHNAQTLEISPIKIVAESRSAHCSPVRSQLPCSPRPHPISRFQQPVMEARRQNLQASSLSNLTLTKPRASMLRMPQPTGRLSRLMRPEPRPSTAPTPATTAPTPAPTAIPRPQASRLPMPRFRASGIPAMKQGARH